MTRDEMQKQKDQNQRSSCILVTGVGHSGTRLVMNMLRKHPDVSVPDAAVLTPNQEYPALLDFFRRVIDKTPLHATDYVIDWKELAFILEAYEAVVNKHKPFFALKMPYYPLNCPEFFLQRYGPCLNLVYTMRSTEKVLASYIRRREDQLFFTKVRELTRQIKKLGVDDRLRYLSEGKQDPCRYFVKLIEHCHELRNCWNENHPEVAFIDLDVEKFATSDEYLISWLQEIGLRQGFVREMQDCVDEGRLLQQNCESRKRISSFLAKCAKNLKRAIA